MNYQIREDIESHVVRIDLSDRHEHELKLYSLESRYSIDLSCISLQKESILSREFPRNTQK
jgi:hypothetical protein